MSHTFVQVPPDSTGKRVSTSEEIDLDYDGGTIAFEVDDIVVGGTSGATGRVISTGAVASGELILAVTDSSLTLFTNNEPLEVLSIQRAVANGTGTRIGTQRVVISSKDDSRLGQSVDANGSAFVRFTDGPQLLDVTGKSQTSGVTPLGLYNLPHDLQPQLLTQSLRVNGSISYDSDDRSALLSVDNTSGSFVQFTSKKYHKVINASGQEILVSSLFGDSGKDGLVRRVGYFDDNDGIFLMSSGSAVYVVLRSSSTGAVIETILSQSAINGIQLSPEVDITNVNQYYFDINQGGRIRVGAFEGGSRTIVHTFNGLNTQSSLQLATSVLPVRAEVENFTATAGSSELRIFNFTVVTQGTFEENNTDHLYQSVDTGGYKEVSSSFPNMSHLFSIRSATTFTGVDNRVIAIPQRYHVSSEPSSAGPIQLMIWRNGTIEGGTWEDAEPLGRSSIEVNRDASFVTGSGNLVWADYIHAGATREEIENTFSYLTEHLSTNADATTTDTYSIVAHKLTGSNPEIHAMISVSEVGP